MIYFSPDITNEEKEKISRVIKDYFIVCVDKKRIYYKIHYMKENGSYDTQISYFDGMNSIRTIENSDIPTFINSRKYISKSTRAISDRGFIIGSK